MEPEEKMKNVVENMTYSYSSINGYYTCPHQFYLTYIERRPRKQNFFSQYGLLVHEILEMYFRNDLEIWDLVQYYKDNYDKWVTLQLPFFLRKYDTYYADGLKFFEEFEFDKSDYEIVAIEDTYREEFKDFKIVVKPDLILKNKKTGENILIDYKTSKLKGNKYDKSKLEGYKKQFLLYTYFTWLNQDVEITKIIIWFIRNNQEFEIKIEHEDIMETLEWFENGVASAKNDTEWKPNLKSSNKFFCENLCSVYEYCEGRNPNAISELSQT